MLHILRRFIVPIVTVPAIALLHYGWYNLQLNPDFVPDGTKVKVAGLDLTHRAEEARKHRKEEEEKAE